MAAKTTNTVPGIPSVDDVRVARQRIAPYIHRTPVLQSELLNELCQARLFFKCENLQKAGAFKSRGAVNAVFALTAQEAAHGVATHSSGNHGSALARAAQLRGIPAYIVVPSNAKAVKKAAIAAYGGEIIECEPTLVAREAMLESVIARTGATFVPPYDDARIIAGQGTAALELIEDVPDLDCLVVPVGGGGLLAGTVLAAETGGENGIPVYGAEPEGAADAHRSFATGERVTTQVPETIADGLLTTLGALNFEIIKAGVEAILLVSDEEIIEAMALLWTRMKLVVEPSSAVTLAAVMRYGKTFTGARVGIILTGGNVDLSDLPF